MSTALWFGLPAFLAGGYWFVRNLINVGNPIPYTTFGPLHLPMPERAFELRPGYSVFHYATDTGVWKDWFFPGLHDSFGLLWPLVLAAFVGGGIYAVWRGGDPLMRVLGAVVLFTALAYVVTPLTAAGEEGAPIAFEWNVRYLAPAAAIGLALLPTLPRLRGSEARRDVTLGALAILFIATTVDLVQWQQGHVKGAIAAGIGVLVAFALIQALRSRDHWGPAAPPRLGRRPPGRGRDRRAGRRLVGAAPLPRAPLREPEPAASSWPMRSAGRATCATPTSPSRASAASSTSSPSTAPTSPTTSSGSGSRGPTAPTSGSRPASSGARRLPTVTTRTSSPPTTRSTRAR